MGLVNQSTFRLSQQNCTVLRSTYVGAPLSARVDLLPGISAQQSLFVSPDHGTLLVEFSPLRQMLSVLVLVSMI